MRTLTDHKLNGLNDALEIQVPDEPGPGGAHHEYLVRATSKVLPTDGFHGDVNVEPDGSYTWDAVWLRFQEGPIGERGVNGISGEALLAINIDRLRCFQAGLYACRENAVALTHLETALMWLQKRTRDRMARGVEGTSAK